MEGCVSNLMVCNLAYSGKLEELKDSILADKSLATRTDQDSRTALHWACSAGHTEIVEFLLQLGVPVNDKDDAGWSPLHIAASAGRDEIVKALLGKGAQIAVMLLEGGANPDAKDHYEATAMHRAAAKGNLKMIHILLYYKASTNIQDTEGNTPLHLACDEERVEEAKLLVSQGASIYIENKEEKTPLQVAKGGLGLILKRMVEG
ncbi:PREDICTED: 26S proteasome non-ATPase regulatory subunit 10 isoform X2 [Ceratotherium simum simum]|uniref:26S proteasome non-ATPase regulatory subunit 10 isoform X2 n=1 Tax=Ceratotherium simum simum TaxID=73337 RepID=A0ABM1DG96_CERSS|nr:PREDICTED: 26S proteasome non-ATPase regulatory subunit 10 isoform X2 [Ceratotherium simum simum]